MQASAKHDFSTTIDEAPRGGFTLRTKSFSPDNINPSEPIIVYGASVYGELAYILDSRKHDDDKSFMNSVKY